MSIAGIITAPIAAEPAIAEPDTPPNSRQAKTVTTPSPPGRKPNSVCAKRTIRLPTPPREISSPPTMNSGTAISTNGSTPPM